MENVIDIRLALEQMGTGWQFGGSVTDGTQEAWDAVTWEDERDKPSWEDLVEAHNSMKNYVNPEPIIISSDTLTYSDADFLYKASVSGNEVASWLLNKFEL